MACARRLAVAAALLRLVLAKRLMHNPTTPIPMGGGERGVLGKRAPPTTGAVGGKKQLKISGGPMGTDKKHSDRASMAVEHDPRLNRASDGFGSHGALYILPRSGEEILEATTGDGFYMEYNSAWFDQAVDREVPQDYGAGVPQPLQAGAGEDSRALTADSTWRHADDVNVAMFSPDGRLVLTASDDGNATLWDPTRGKPLRTWDAHAGWPVMLAGLSPDSKYALTASGATAKLWHVKTGRALTTFDLGGVSLGERLDLGQGLVAFSPDGTHAVFVFGGRVMVLGLVTGRRQVWQLEKAHHGADVIFAMLSADGRRALTASEDGTVKVWDFEAKSVHTLSGHGLEFVNTAVFAPSGSSVLTASGDGTARIWNLQTKTVRTLRHAHSVWSAVFAPDSRRVLTTSADTAYVWNLESGKVELTLGGHDGPLVSAWFSPNGRRAITSSFLTTQVWSL